MRLSEGVNTKRHPKLYIDPRGHTVTLAPESFDGNTPEASIIVQGNGTVKVLSDVTPATAFQCNGTARVSVKPGVSLGSGTVSVASGATFEVAESGTVALGGSLTLADDAALGFNYTGTREPVLDLTGRTVTFAEGETTNVTVKVSAAEGKMAHSGANILTAGGAFAGVNVTLAPVLQNGQRAFT